MEISAVFTFGVVMNSNDVVKKGKVKKGGGKRKNARTEFEVSTPMTHDEERKRIRNFSIEVSSSI